MAAAFSNPQEKKSNNALSVNDFLPTEGSKRSHTKVDQQFLDVGAAKQWRIDIWEETKQCLENGSYLPWRGQPNEKNSLPPIDSRINVLNLQQTTKMSANNANNNNNTANKQQRPPLKITCFRGDCLDAARDAFVKYDGCPPLVMNAASHRRPGGGYRNGSRAQEEEMCRRSSLAFQIDTTWRVQKQNPYPLKNGTGILVTNTSVFRAGATENYAFLPHPFQVHFGVVAAPNQPGLTPSGDMMDEEAQMMKNSLSLFFRMGVMAGAKAIVPVSLGCGAFRCPAGHVAQLMMQAITEECVGTCVEEVFIAIFDDHNAVRRGNEEGNFVPFARSAFNFFGEHVVTVVDGNTGEDLRSEIFPGKKFQPPASAANQGSDNSNNQASKAAVANSQQQQQQQQQPDQKKTSEVKYELV